MDEILVDISELDEPELDKLTDYEDMSIPFEKLLKPLTKEDAVRYNKRMAKEFDVYVEYEFEELSYEEYDEEN